MIDMTRTELEHAEQQLLDAMGRAIDELEVAAALAQRTGALWLKDWLGTAADGLREIHQESQIDGDDND